MIATRFAIQAAEHAPPSWYVLRTYRQQWAAAWLEANGVEAWYPTSSRWQSRVVQGKQKRVEVVRPVVSGYVFAAFCGVPIWHEIRERSLGRITGVLCGSDGMPRIFKDAEMMQMNSVPHRLEEMRREEETRKRLHPGDTVLHPAFGRVRVKGVDGPLATFIAPLFGAEREVVVEVTSLEKVS